MCQHLWRVVTTRKMVVETLMPTDKSRRDNAIGVAYERLRSSLLRYASRYLKRNHEIEDVVQEAFVKVLKADGDKTIHSIDAYLFRTARNLALNSLRSCDYRLTEALGDILADPDATPGGTLEDELETRQRFELFCESLLALPKRCQQAFVLRRVYGFSQAEIAERMQISEATVEKHITNGVVRCERFMRKNSDDGEGVILKRNRQCGTER